MRLAQPLLATALIGFALSVPGWPAETDAWNASIGVEYTTGDYGTSNTTEVWYVPAMFRHAFNRTMLGVEVPVIITQGTGEVQFSGGHGRGRRAVPAATTDTRETTDAGLGDVLLWARYALLPQAVSRPSIDVTGQVKLPTASESDNLGTGETDYELQVDLAKRYDWGYLFGGVGVRFLGDPPGQDFDDPLFYNIGSEYSLPDGQALGVSWDWAEASTSTGSNLSELLVYYNKRLDRTRGMQSYVILGLAEGSPDFGIGVLLWTSDW